MNDVEALRDFNRFYTRQLGLLDRGLLGSKWTLAEVRVMYELARAGTTTATTIASDLALDVAYLSRILAKLEKQKLVVRRRATDDARKQLVALTAKGRTTFAPLDAAARDEVRALLEPLAGAERRELNAAVATVKRLLSHAPARCSSPVEVRELAIGDLGWITHRQALLYAEEYGWNIEFEALVAEILGAFVKNFDPKRDAAFVAERDGEVVGSVFLVRDEARTAKLRLLYVDKSARGLGLGRRLVDLCIEAARARGYAKLTLWTNDVLVSARKIYEGAGFRLVKENRHTSFGKKLVGQTWEISLA